MRPPHACARTSAGALTGLLVAIACLALAAAASATTPSATTPATPPRAELTHFSCRTALDPANRAIGIDAVMRPVTGTEHLEIRFELVRRVGRAAPTVVHGGDLGTWISPDNPTLGQLPGDVWRLDKSVLNLNAPGAYRFRVTFRWIGAGGQVLATDARRTRLCRQRELRPDLLVKSVTVSPVAGSSQQDLYSAVIANRGLTGAGPFEVLLAPGSGSGAVTRTVKSLGAGRSLSLSLVGPVCDPTTPPSITVDATHQVDDYNRANNTLTTVCTGTATAMRRAARARPAARLR